MEGLLMKRILLGIVSIPILIILLINIKSMSLKKKSVIEEGKESGISTIIDFVQPGETLEAIFKKYNFDKAILSDVVHAAEKLYNLSKLSVGNLYFFKVDRQNSIKTIYYEIDDESFLKITMTPHGFSAEKIDIKYNKRIGSLYIKIKDNLIFSMPSSHREYLKLALELSDIYAWDIDFSSDIRNGDSVKIIVEELWIGDIFKGYGNIIAAEFFNNGRVYRAYRFAHNGHVDYYDEKGKSLRKSLLRSPLRFRYISSYFTKRRFHPILRIYRPHLGVDYVAPEGTPVSAAGDGIVVFSGYKGQYGKMVRIKHTGGFETYYGHLSRIPKRIRRGVRVSQGDIIGYVGATGLATGPHLDYRIKFNGRFVNPLKVHLPRVRVIPKTLMAEFKKTVEDMDVRLASLTQPIIAYSGRDRDSG